MRALVKLGKMFFISLQKLFSLWKKSNFRILDIQVSWRHQMSKHKISNTFYWITWEVNKVCYKGTISVGFNHFTLIATLPLQAMVLYLGPTLVFSALSPFLQALSWNLTKSFWKGSDYQELLLSLRGTKDRIQIFVTLIAPFLFLLVYWALESALYLFWSQPQQEQPPEVFYNERSS